MRTSRTAYSYNLSSNSDLPMLEAVPASLPARSASIGPANMMRGVPQSAYALVPSWLSHQRKALKDAVNSWAKNEKNRYISDTHKKISEILLCTHRLSYSEVNLSRFRVPSLPDCFDHLPMLKILNLKNMGLSELPESIGRAWRLETVDVSCNELTKIPTSLGTSRKLVYLDASYNKLTCLPDELRHWDGMPRTIIVDNQRCSLSVEPDSDGPLGEEYAISVSENSNFSLEKDIENKSQPFVKWENLGYSNCFPKPGEPRHKIDTQNVPPSDIRTETGCLESWSEWRSPTFKQLQDYHIVGGEFQLKE